MVVYTWGLLRWRANVAGASCRILNDTREHLAAPPPSPQLRRCVNHVYTQMAAHRCVGAVRLCLCPVSPVCGLRTSLCVFQLARSPMCNWWLMRQLASLIVESISRRWLTFERRSDCAIGHFNSSVVGRCPRRANGVLHLHAHTYICWTLVVI